MVEKSWNTSFRIMYDLPYATHRYFVQPVSEKPHARNLLLGGFLRFVKQVEQSAKSVPRNLLNLVKKDTRSTTGSNLRNILLMTTTHLIEEVEFNDIKHLEYAPTKLQDVWKIASVREIVDIKAGMKTVENLTYDELEEILEFLCTS